MVRVFVGSVGYAVRDSEQVFKRTRQRDKDMVFPDLSDKILAAWYQPDAKIRHVQEKRADVS